MSNTSPQCKIGDHTLCKVVSKSGIRCACECHLTTEERQAKREHERIESAAFRAAHPDYLPTYGASNADMERHLGAKKARDDGGRELDYYEIEPDENHISGACDPNGFNHQFDPCYDSHCHCACHQPTAPGADFYEQRRNEYQQMRSQASGSALLAPEPEKHHEKIIIIENVTGSDVSMLRNGTHPRFARGTVEPEGVIVAVTHVASEPQLHRLEVTVDLESASKYMARLHAEITKLETQRDAAPSAARGEYQYPIDKLQQQIDRIQQQGRVSGSALLAPEPERHEETTEQPDVTSEPRIAVGRVARVEVRMTPLQKDMLNVFCRKTGNHLSTFIVTAAITAMKDEMMKHPGLFL